MNSSLGFIGGGRVVRILLGGFKHAGVTLTSVVVSDPNPETLARLKRLHPEVTLAGADNDQPAAQDVVFLAVHPPMIPAVLPAIQSALKPDTILVSLAPKFTLAKLSELLGGVTRLARVIPNAPSLIGAGYNPISFHEALNNTDRRVLAELWSPLGDCPAVPEEKLEGFALLTGMGPTYLWFQLQALRELAVDFGLTEDDINPALKRMVCGGTRTLLESGLTSADVMDLIPVKPLAEDEGAIRQAYRTRLPALFAKIKP